MLQRRYLTYSILVLGAVACAGDKPVTGPGQETLQPPSFQTITPPSGTVTLTPTASNQGIPEQTVVSYAEQTLVTVRATGQMTMTNNHGGPAGQLDAGGSYSATEGGCTGNVWVAFAGSVGFCAGNQQPDPAHAWTVTTLVQGNGRVSWIAGPYSPENCGGPCFTFTGDGFTVTITPATVDFNVTASPTTLKYNDSVTVTVTVSPAQVSGVNVPWRIDSTTWAPAFGTQASPCVGTSWVAPDAGTRTCRRPFGRSGTLTVFATVNGVKAQGGVTITVTPPELDVTAAPPTIQGPNSVTFTATVTPSSIPYNSWSLSGWTWTPDSGTGGASPCNWNEKTCSRMVSRSGWMKAAATIGGYALADSAHVTVTPPVFDVTATPASIPGPQSVTFTASVTPSPPNGWNLSSNWTWRPDSGTGGISASCAWNEKTCTRTVSKSGWMKATTVIGAYTLTDSARVYVIPCPTGDSLVDREPIRKLLPSLWSQASPTAPPANRVERGGYVYDSLGFDITVPSVQAPGDNPCQNANLRTRTLPIVVGVHVHPFSTGDTLPWQQCGLPPLLPGQTYVMGHTWGGPSAPDWVRSWIDQAPHIVMDADSIYRFGPPDSLHAQVNPSNPSDTTYIPAGNWASKIHSYPRNAGSCTRP